MVRRLDAMFVAIVVLRTHEEAEKVRRFRWLALSLEPQALLAMATSICCSARVAPLVLSFLDLLRAQRFKKKGGCRRCAMAVDEAGVLRRVRGRCT
ncbi:hypothetical protein L7F22_035871 [Adiantum nelumboides]|nr:hypothetical protein [Adiantum nelumboides]